MPAHPGWRRWAARWTSANPATATRRTRTTTAMARTRCPAQAATRRRGRRPRCWNSPRRATTGSPCGSMPPSGSAPDSSGWLRPASHLRRRGFEPCRPDDDAVARVRRTARRARRRVLLLAAGRAAVRPRRAESRHRRDFRRTRRRTGTGRSKLPALLHWDSEPVVYLNWCRVHARRVPTATTLGGRRPHQTRHCSPPAPVHSSTSRAARLTRCASRSPAGCPCGYQDPTAPGFRYDLATDSAVVLPLVVAPSVPPAGAYPGGLDSYPYFAYSCPGAPVEPLSLFMVALTVAGDAACPLPVRGSPEVVRASRRTARCGQRMGDVRTSGARPGAPTCKGDGTADPTRCAAARAGPRVVARTRRCAPARGPHRHVPCWATDRASDDAPRRRAVARRPVAVPRDAAQWGDALMRRNTSESFRQADVVFDTLGRDAGEHLPDRHGGRRPTPRHHGHVRPATRPRSTRG